ncbi:LPS-assembly protein LptD [Sphingomonas jatrophae]|uniref:LPS-assembly protein LptD n=1 Tax=Sphingomonas jatrophae TaxID=1166337 RepID=A0A1I6L5F4_9SPHN|nr:LPS assembly protein LptD [Sphingomonas jatrophae]SFR98637.1 LPS-assembly protein [Sphingomonas jatrophae]
MGAVLHRHLSFGLSTLALAAAWPARAQDLQTPPTPPPLATPDVPVPANDEEVTFSADQLDYDDQTERVVATGEVRMIRAGNRLRADKVTWDRKTGDVIAEGSVAVANPQGDIAYGDSVQLKDTLRDGVIDNLLLVLEDGGRLAAQRGTRVDNVSTLEHAAYTPCRVTDDAGCPKTPSWQITAVRVVHDPKKHRISYRDARLSLFGLPILWLPALSHPDGSGEGGSGLLVPTFRISRTNGVEVATPYYMPFGPNRDLTITPHVYSDVAPALEAQWRSLSSTGAYQVGGMITYGSRLPAELSIDPSADGKSNVRGYLDASGRFQLGPYWTLTGSTRLATDKTFLRRYDISRDDRLRTIATAERIDADSYLVIGGYAVQNLRPTVSQRNQPIALPAIDYRRRLDFAGGVVEAQVNSLFITRTSGQDTQRAFAGLRWDLRRYTTMGQEVTLTAYGRGDIYHTANVSSTLTASYRGDPGWTPRAIGALAADVRWPFAGALAGGTQIVAPRVQFVASPHTRNLAIPNEDARAIELEDSNLFALNRFPGYDRWEDGSRVTYGLEWQYDRPRFSVRSIVGQSYRLTRRETILPDGTGLGSRFSDVVGRTTLRYGDFVSLTHRFRADKDGWQLRRNELDVTLGGRRTYVMVGYLRLNRDIDTAIEDLRDREEVRLGGRVQITRTLSAFGSTTLDLTSAAEDPLSIADGYEPVRHRLGVLYDDECLELGVTWRRDYARIGDARRGNSFLFQLAFKNLGR